MADLGTKTGNIVVHKDYEDLRQKVFVPDSKSKTKKWLEAQVQERTARVAATKATILSCEGTLEVLEDELEVLKERLAKLEQLK